MTAASLVLQSLGILAASLMIALIKVLPICLAIELIRRIPWLHSRINRLVRI